MRPDPPHARSPRAPRWTLGGRGPVAAPWGLLRGALQAVLLSVLLGTLLGACREAAPERPPLRLLGVQPADRSRLYLNEPLVLTFSEPLDRSSVIPDSVQIFSGAGPADGEWRVEGATLEFVPHPILAADLSDGGYVPGETYTVVVTGFPELLGLRSASGAPLERTWRFNVTCAEAGPDAIYDRSLDPSRCEPVTLAGAPPGPSPVPMLGVGDPIELQCAEPLHPTTVQDEDFWVVDAAEPGVRIPVRARLIENHHFESLDEGPCARIELWPVRPLEPDHSYQVLRSPGARLTDMSGNRAWPGPLDPVLGVVRVWHQPRETAGRVRVDFLGEAASPVAVPWADGSARWGDRGLVLPGLFEGVGGGEAGDLSLEGELTFEDLSCVRARVPAGETFALDGGRGLVVLRAQGSIVVEGDLVRRPAEYDAAHAEASASNRLPEDGGPSPSELRGGHLTLGTWLEEARATDRDWTVLIAGGDIEVLGEVKVATPLILVAGGRVRLAYGSVSCGGLSLVGRGGGQLKHPPQGLDLRLEPPVRNPLREELLWAAVSSPLPRLALERYHWGRVEASGSAGCGSFRVAYLPADGPILRERVADHPGLLAEPGPLRVLVELRVPPTPGLPWDPPSVDVVELSWR